MLDRPHLSGLPLRDSAHTQSAKALSSILPEFCFHSLFHSFIHLKPNIHLTSCLCPILTSLSLSLSLCVCVCVCLPISYLLLSLNVGGGVAVGTFTKLRTGSTPLAWWSITLSRYVSKSDHQVKSGQVYFWMWRNEQRLLSLTLSLCSLNDRSTSCCLPTSYDTTSISS